MASVATKSKQTLSYLGRRLCKNLLGPASASIACADSGMIVKGDVDITTAKGITEEATGTYYKAFGHYYVRCYDPLTLNLFVKIIRVVDRKLLARITQKNINNAATTES